MWCVLHTTPNRETQVCKYLAVQGIQAYAPQFPPPPRTKPGSVRARRHRWVFPGYVFLMVPQGFLKWDIIRWAPGVRRMLQQDGAPAVITDEIVDHLRRRLAERALAPARSPFSPGQQVVIERGPLRMVDAIFERELDGPARVRILIQILGRPVPVEVDPATLRAAG